MQLIENRNLLAPSIGRKPLINLVPECEAYFLDSDKEGSIARQIPVTMPRFNPSFFGERRTRKNLFSCYARLGSAFSTYSAEIRKVSD